VTRTIEESIEIREWIKAAVGAGCKNPSAVLEWLEQRMNDKVKSPSVSTIGRIMTDMGYKPTGIKWEKE